MTTERLDQVDVYMGDIRNLSNIITRPSQFLALPIASPISLTWSGLWPILWLWRNNNYQGKSWYIGAFDRTLWPSAVSSDGGSQAKNEWGERQHAYLGIPKKVTSMWEALDSIRLVCSLELDKCLSKLPFFYIYCKCLVCIWIIHNSQVFDFTWIPQGTAKRHNVNTL